VGVSVANRQLILPRARPLPASDGSNIIGRPKTDPSAVLALDVTGL
jgi:hypothetical protein